VYLAQYLMAVTKQQKADILDVVRRALDGAATVAFVESNGLPVADNQAMRRTLRERGVSFYVAKKTLITRALAERSYVGTRPAFERELALAWGSDQIAPAREVQEFVKSTKERVRLVGGIFEGRYLSAAEITEVASIPSQHTLRAQFVMLINSPLQQFVMALDQIAKKREA